VERSAQVIDVAVANGADINPAALADQELGGARAKAVGLDQGPVYGVDINRAVGIAGRARVVGAAKPTGAGAAAPSEIPCCSRLNNRR